MLNDVLDDTWLKNDVLAYLDDTLLINDVLAYKKYVIDKWDFGLVRR